MHLRSTASRQLVISLLAATVLAGCAGRSVPAVDVAAAAVGATSPMAGDVLIFGGWPQTAAFVQDASAAGDASVVNIFASWCAPCEAELPVLLAASENEPGVQFLGVASEDRVKEAAPFIERMAVTWPTILDLTATTHIAFEGIAMPTTAFFDVTGSLVSVVTGLLTPEMLADELSRIRP
ncbi:MAG: thiol-disulfide isomerase/thioredoxin [Nonlabens sp.]